VSPRSLLLRGACRLVAFPAGVFFVHGMIGVRGPVAQLVERRALDPKVAGSSPTWLTERDMQKAKNKPITRQRIWSRENGRCFYCKNVLQLKDGTIDHVVPRAAGGGGEERNIVWACHKCNNRKGDTMPKHLSIGEIKERVTRPGFTTDGIKVEVPQFDDPNKPWVTPFWYWEPIKKKIRHIPRRAYDVVTDRA
jgi:5-methylcytosine-specific restriction endonuclease McrA